MPAQAQREQSAISRYGVAAALIVVALATRLALSSILLYRAPTLLMTIAVMLSALWGGMSAGIFATLFGTTLVAFFLLSPEWSLLVGETHDIASLVLFVIVGLMISWIASNAQKARRHAEDSARAAMRHWDALAVSDERVRTMTMRVSRWKYIYDALVEASDQVLYSWNPDSDEIAIYGGIETLLGRSLTEFGAKMSSWIELIHPDDREHYLATVRRIAETGERRRQRYRIFGHGNQYLQVEDRGYVLKSDSGDVLRVVGLVIEETPNFEQRLSIVGQVAGAN